MNGKRIAIFRGLTLAVLLVAGLALDIRAAPADDADAILADCKKTLDKKLKDCCEDFGERADRGIKNIEKALKEKKCSTPLKKQGTSLNLIGDDFDKCTLKLGDLGGNCFDELEDAIEDAEALAEAKAKVNALLKGVAKTLTDCYDKERQRILDAYTPDADCDDDDSGGDN